MEPLVQRLKNEIQRMLLRRSLPKVDIVFCQTTAAAARFRQTYGFDNVAAWPNAVSAAIPEDAARSDLPERVAPHADSFKLFALTRYYPHKNLEAIVDAFELYPDLMAGTVCFTTIAAEHHRWAGRLLQRIEDSVPGRVINLGPIDQGDVRWYFESMDALMQPTLLESHSGSYIEAMAFCVPVITSDLDFAHAVCGPAAEYFDPHDVKTLAQAVAKLRDDPQQRDHLVAAGREQLSKLGCTWDEGIAAALDTLGVPYP
jgi:glycosyltransferase involved in cell wall biosynthesis